ncbi:MAG: PDZ domain-containing protein, partial [Syntrophorhabdales bacterium]
GRIIGAGPYDDFIQTDAPINPGNSGGPLFNMGGEVIGITTAIIPNGQGIGFAIPINTAKALLPELVTKGKVTRGYLGVNIQDITDELAASLGLKGSRGALVAEVVQGGPAEKAGVKRGDVITAIDGKEIKDSHDLATHAAATPIGKEVPLRLVRNGLEMTLKVKVGMLKAQEADTGKGEATPQDKWGLQLRELNPEVARQMGLRQDQGVVVAGVRPGSPADEASIQRGDIILEANRKPVKGVEDLREKMANPEGSDRLLLLVQRDQGTFYLVLKK